MDLIAIGVTTADFSFNPIWRLGTAGGRSLRIQSFPSFNLHTKHGV